MVGGLPVAKGVPDGDAPGQSLYDGLGRHSTVIGIVRQMHGARVGWKKPGNVAILPRVMPANSTNYPISTEPGLVNRTLTQVEKTLFGVNDQRVLRDLRPHKETRNRSRPCSCDLKRPILLLPVGILAIRAPGLLAVAGPARRASGISTAIATRTIHTAPTGPNRFGIVGYSREVSR